MGQEMRGSRTAGGPSKKANRKKRPTQAEEAGRADKRSGGPSRPGPQWAVALAPVAVCVYIVGFALPFQSDIPLIALALMSVFAFAAGSKERRSSWPPLALPVVIFLATTGVDTANMATADSVG